MSLKREPFSSLFNYNSFITGTWTGWVDSNVYIIKDGALVNGWTSSIYSVYNSHNSTYYTSSYPCKSPGDGTFWLYYYTGNSIATWETKLEFSLNTLIKPGDNGWRNKANSQWWVTTVSACFDYMLDYNTGSILSSSNTPTLNLFFVRKWTYTNGSSKMDGSTVDFKNIIESNVTRTTKSYTSSTYSTHKLDITIQLNRSSSMSSTYNQHGYWARLKWLWVTV